MKTNHTPGPWGVVPGTNHFHIKASDCYVAKTVNDTVEAKANARLIAAAPELLDALAAIRALVDGDFDHPSLVAFGPLSENKLEDVSRLAQTAIAKATQSQP